MGDFQGVVIARGAKQEVALVVGGAQGHEVVAHQRPHRDTPVIVAPQEPRSPAQLGGGVLIADFRAQGQSAQVIVAADKEERHKLGPVGAGVDVEDVGARPDVSAQHKGAAWLDIDRDLGAPIAQHHAADLVAPVGHLQPIADKARAQGRRQIRSQGDGRLSQRLLFDFEARFGLVEGDRDLGAEKPLSGKAQGVGLRGQRESKAPFGVGLGRLHEALSEPRPEVDPLVVVLAFQSGAA